MAWITSPTGQRYYYRRRKVNGRVQSIYCGTGDRAELAAAEDSLRRFERAYAYKRRDAGQQRWQLAIAPVNDFARLTDLMTHATLLAAGCYLHARSWRRSQYATVKE